MPAEPPQPPQLPEPPGTPQAAQPGPDLARAALERARAAFAAPTRRPRPPRPRRDRDSAGADRDPALLGAALADLLAERGWQPSVAAASVLARWAELVGPEVAGHSRPDELRDGELTVTAESTAWATQLRLLEPQLLARIAEAVGRGVVGRLRVRGPVAPDWGHGPRRVRGRGPRDTYG